MIKFKLLFLLILFFTKVNSQNSCVVLDSLMMKEPDKMLADNVSRQKIIDWNLLMIKKAQKENCKKAIIWGNINLGVQHYNLAKPDISLTYLNKAKILSDEISADNETYSRIFQEFSQTYFTLGMYDVSLKYNSKAMYYGRKITNIKYKNWFLSFVYNTRSGTLSQSKKDSALFYLHKASAALKNPVTYSALAGYYISNNIHTDSARFYLNNAEKFYNKEKKVNPYSLSVLYYRYACLYANEKNNEKSLEYLEKSLNLASNGKNRQHLLNVYNLLAEMYRKTGDIDKEKKILEEYKKFNESYKDAQARSVDITIQNLEKELSEKQDDRNKKIIIITLFLLLILTVLLFYYIKNKKNSVKPENTIDEVFTVAEKKEEILPSVTLDELYESAKSRDPNFYNKFQIFYPDFFKKLTEFNSDLQKNELHILAYIYLNFETKQIADILYLSPKTIQNKKYNIRKKLNMQTNEDMYIWLKVFYQ
ncbi:tetratricopeptide repeat protein [Chryseobacterium taihuense]|uniref:DNA-binding transcriptional regulator, CsgD family n=1 Tax=Chryseobacterium taihuense TaxID=1141221 RepID=A0ABY0QPF2_9FLAO|nr:tetratricopeptide repeat protein [Chryseobacterium taihuense]SDL43671.1 DNA-binding transcriptional regulator, CsgD family [Chryseobacterium taihuense]